MTTLSPSLFLATLSVYASLLFLAVKIADCCLILRSLEVFIITKANYTFSYSTAISKLNNFTRLEPTLHLLGISFDINTAEELMQEKQGVATRLLYQLYISLEKTQRAQISGTVMEIMEPAANAGLHKKEHEIYSDVRGDCNNVCVLYACG